MSSVTGGEGRIFSLVVQDKKTSSSSNHGKFIRRPMNYTKAKANNKLKEEVIDYHNVHVHSSRHLKLGNGRQTQKFTIIYSPKSSSC